MITKHERLVLAELIRKTSAVLMDHSDPLSRRFKSAQGCHDHASDLIREYRRNTLLNETSNHRAEWWGMLRVHQLPGWLFGIISETLQEVGGPRLGPKRKVLAVISDPVQSNRTLETIAS